MKSFGSLRLRFLPYLLWGGLLFFIGAEGMAQSLPIRTHFFVRNLSEPYSTIIQEAEILQRASPTPAQVDSALQAIDDHLEIPDLGPRLRVCYLAVRGQVLIRSKRVSAAYAYCKAANDLAVEQLAEDDLIRGYAQAAYGSYLGFYKTPELALLPLQQSLRSLPKLHDSSSLPYRGIINSTIRIAIELGQLEDAARHHAANVAFLEAHQDTVTMARFINNYGFFLQREGYHHRAVVAFDEGLNLFDKPTHIESLKWYVNLLESKAHSLIASQQFDRGIGHLREAYFTRKSLDLNDWALQAMGYLINYWMEDGRHQEALAFFRKEQAFFAKAGKLTPRKYKLYQYLGELMTHFGYDQEAATYFSLYNDYAANSLLPRAEAKLNTPNALSEHILLQKRAQEQAATIDKLEISQLRKDVQLRQSGIALLGLTLTLFVCGGLVYRWHYRRAETERQRAEADRRRILQLENDNLKYRVTTRERDLKRLAADNRLRTQLKREMLQRIETISKLPKGEKEGLLSKLRAELSSTIEEQEAISKLQDQVETINAAFEDQLRIKVPGITAQEIRYCSLLRLGMNNQQIAQLLNKSDATIRTYKHRITKKAGLAGRNALRALVEKI